MAFEAYENKKFVRAYLIKQLPEELIKQKKFECPCCNQEMNFVKEYYKLKGTWRAHFAHLKNSACNGYTPEGESLEHYTLKMTLLDDLHNNKPLEIKVNGLTWTFDNSLVDYIKDEKYEIENRRADIIIMLKTPNFILGNGVAIEVMVSEKQSSIQNKAIDYAQQLLSVAQTTNGSDIEITQTYPKVLKDFFESTFKQYKAEINYYEERIKLIRTPFIEKALKNNWTCLNCKHPTKTDYKFDKHGVTITCWRKWIKGVKGSQVNRTDFAPCENYAPSDEPELILDCKGVVSCSKKQQ